MGIDTQPPTIGHALRGLLVWALTAGLAIALFAIAALYAVALVSALAHGGCCLFYQTERLHESISVREHTWIGVAAYALLCGSLFAAAFAFAKKKAVALGLLLVAIPLLANDTGGALFDAFFAMPWAPKNGPAFDAFYNVRKIPEKFWYVMLGVVTLAATLCALHVLASRRLRRANGSV